MLNHLKLLVSSAVLIGMFIIPANAKEIPITEEVELTIPLGEFTVIEFPFKIESKNITSFMLSNPSDLIAERKNIHTNNNILNKKVGVSKKPPVVRKKRYITIKQNVNSFTIFTKKVGTFKMVVWGYKSPLLISIKVAKSGGFPLYQFKAPESNKADIAKTEQGSHEKIINTLMVNLFNQTLPKGYKSNSRDVLYNSNGFSIRLNREIIGTRYMGQEWILTNHSKSLEVLHEESFYEKGVFGVAMEADSIDVNESSRIFLVKSASKKGKKI